MSQSTNSNPSNSTPTSQEDSPLSSAEVTSRDLSDHRRPYERPSFIVSQAFERQALSCAGCLNQTASFPAFCAMRS